MKKGILIAALAGGVMLGTTTAQAADVVIAQNGQDLADWIKEANDKNQIGTIRCVGFNKCDLGSSDLGRTLPTYTGSQRLVIDGKGSTIDASGITDIDAFSSTGGGKLKLKRLNFLGGMSGIYVEVPADKKWLQQVVLQQVTVRDAALHGVFINDGAKSAAGVKLIIRASKFIGNGFGGGDQDGVRVDETGPGAVSVEVLGSVFRANGADGLSLDERGGGDVSVTLAGSKFLENGPNPVNPLDPDDGFDVDENGGGNVFLVITDSRFNKNYDDGIDVDERGPGSIYSDLDNVKASRNLDQGITYDERENGGVFATINDSSVVGNDVGSQNIDIRGKQSDNGSGTLTLDNVAVGNLSLSGVKLITLP
jgi:hypothetical protein